MTQFTVKLAGIPIGISLLYPENAAPFAEYLTDDAPRLSLAASPASLEQERTLTRQRYRADIPMTDAALESQWLYHQIAGALPKYGAVLFHGSAVAVDGAAYLFAAPSHTGKSTHARLWRENLGPRAVMINDDRPLLTAGPQGITVWGSPWRGKHRLGANLSAPLAAICVLEQAEENRISPLPLSEGFSRLLRQCFRTEDPEATRGVLAILDAVAARVPLYRMGCNVSLEAAKLAYETMSQKQEGKRI